ncbi:hypothetical protein AJ80_05252 [Polytolypa hystricis UAMH7299]|uniref:Uncharacterized protein n=1 Tax=Polytolypa hystricis (strain UAMH7299) TaxID=1447883 RepID=A0A2B7Y530_POLH7|nr:hypothetical protein AJ80_05252 [Polytolypa hystricis UAMH7299]
MSSISWPIPGRLARYKPGQTRRLGIPYQKPEDWNALSLGPVPRSSGSISRYQRPYSVQPAIKHNGSVAGEAEPLDGSVAPSNRISNRYTRSKSSAPYRLRGMAAVASMTPSDYLVSALKDGGFEVGLYEGKDRHLDLSWIHPNNSRPRGTRGLKLRTLKDSGFPLRPPRLGKATVTGSYIRHLYPLLQNEQSSTNLDQEISRVFDDATLTYLSAGGYSVEDVVAWAWILTSPDSYRAALRYLAYENFNREKGLQRKQIPLFVLLFILRREHIKPHALKILLLEAWNLLGHPPRRSSVVSCEKPEINSARGGWDWSGDYNSLAILFVRLVRHARAVSPATLLPISAMFTSALGCHAITGGSGILKHKQACNLTFIYNRFLSLLSVRSHLQPFLWVSVQQRAQFQLLREMKEFRPPLVVNREGYQAVTTVQLAHKKTPEERKWAEFKSLSWPPWKEEKLGMDFERGNEGSQSRAFRSLTHMRNSGYTSRGWERVASTLSGWDTDGTPTIQTRTFHPHRNDRFSGHFKPPNNPKSKKDWTELSSLWSARIRSTRTIKEAWACFLSYQEKGIPKYSVYHIYSALIEKMLFHEKAMAHRSIPPNEALPGDGKEVFPDPSSPKDIIYVPSEPPSVEDLLPKMISDGVEPAGQFLALLLVHARSFDIGMQCLSHSGYSNAKVLALTTRPTSEVQQSVLSSIPQKVFAAFIAFLCKFSPARGVGQTGVVHMQQLFPIMLLDYHTPECVSLASTTTIYHQSDSVGSASTNATKSSSLSPAVALEHAIHLLRLRMPSHRRPWLHLLSAVANEKRRVPAHFRVPLSMQRVVCWFEICQVLEWMKEAHCDVDDEGLETVCRALSKVIITSSQDPEGAERGLKFAARAGCKRLNHHATIPGDIKGLVNAGIELVKGHFDRLRDIEGRRSSLLPKSRQTTESLGDDFPAVPTLFSGPAPAELHSLVRILGLAHDQDGLLRLLRWMKEYAGDISHASTERLDGRRSLRLTVVAFRVFLEGYWDDIVATTINPGTESSKDAAIHAIEEKHDQDDESEDLDYTEDAEYTMFSDPVLQEAYDIIESTECLQPWPIDEEVGEYLDIGLERLNKHVR